jgi:hypothetical protein
MVSPKLTAVFRLSAIATGAAALSLPFVSSPANAFSFTGFNFKTNFTTEVPFSNPDYTKYDIRLDSVGYDQTNNYATVNSASNLVKSVKVINNGFISAGPMSSDRGDCANGNMVLPGQVNTPCRQITVSTPANTGLIDQNNIRVGSVVEKPSPVNLLDSLRTRNLNSLVDTEDSWSGGQVASIDVIFDKPTNRFFFWERGTRKVNGKDVGGNSDLMVQAIDVNGNLISPSTTSTIIITRDLWQDAGFASNTILSVNTTEIGDNQRIGAYGLVWSGGNIAGLRISASKNYNGPDFQVRAANPVPEPLTILGSGIALAFGIHAKRKLQSSPK